MTKRTCSELSRDVTQADRSMPRGNIASVGALQKLTCYSPHCSCSFVFYPAFILRDVTVEKYQTSKVQTSPTHLQFPEKKTKTHYCLGSGSRWAQIVPRTVSWVHTPRKRDPSAPQWIMCVRGLPGPGIQMWILWRSLQKLTCISQVES